MEIRGYAPDLLQRMPGQTGGHAVDTSWQLAAHGSGQVRASAIRVLALERAASVGVCIRYGWSHAIPTRLDPTQPIARPATPAPILRSEFVTHSQLFEFTQLHHYERSRNSFHWRIRRLVDRGLVLRQTLVAGTGDAVYSVANSAATLLQSMGEYCLVGCSRQRRRKRTETFCMPSD